jgi:hypothetical protein
MTRKQCSGHDSKKRLVHKFGCFTKRDILFENLHSYLHVFTEAKTAPLTDTAENEPFKSRRNWLRFINRRRFAGVRSHSSFFAVVPLVQGCLYRVACTTEVNGSSALPGQLPLEQNFSKSLHRKIETFRNTWFFNVFSEISPIFASKREGNKKRWTM